VLLDLLLFGVGVSCGWSSAIALIAAIATKVNKANNTYPHTHTHTHTSHLNSIWNIENM
jgi:Na+-transporting NADH:ubiquinone oxidoreductase subunit NqrE